MKKLWILLIATFMIKGVFGQNPCDAELLDTLLQTSDSKFYLKDMTWDSDLYEDKQWEQKLILRKNVRYQLAIGNSKNSETPVNFKFIYVESETKKKKMKVPLKIRSPENHLVIRDTIITLKTNNLEKTGKKQSLENLEISPGEVYSYDFVVNKTAEYRIRLSKENEKKQCIHMGLFFIKKVSVY